MSNFSCPNGASKIIGFALSLVLLTVLFWAATAQAQTPSDVQYEERTAPSGLKASESAGKAKSDGNAKAGKAKTGVLPATGGPLFLVYVGVLAASGAGLVLFYSCSRRDV